MGIEDYHQFRHLKKRFAGKRFVTDADMKQGVTSWLMVLDRNYFYVRIKALVLRQDKFLNVRPREVLVLSERSESKVLRIRVSEYLLIYFLKLPYTKENQTFMQNKKKEECNQTLT